MGVRFIESQYPELLSGGDIGECGDSQIDGMAGQKKPKRDVNCVSPEVNILCTFRGGYIDQKMSIM